MCLSFQTKLQLWFEQIFSAWADIVSLRTWLVFTFSAIVLIGLSKFQKHLNLIYL